MFRMICSSAFLVIALITQGYADEHFPFLGEVSKNSVNVRAGANPNFEKVDKLSRGTQVVVLGKSYQWYKIQPSPAVKAYIRADYLKIQEGGLMAQIIGDKVNVRALANSDSSSLGQLKKGAFVKVIEQSHGWYRVEPPAGTAVWVHQDFVTMKSAQVPLGLMAQPIQFDSANAHP